MHSGPPALSKVAALVGYQNYRDFHRNFVRYQNASPKNFKRDLKRCVDP
jgi:YesN/AraC family two-component response regulator